MNYKKLILIPFLVLVYFFVHYATDLFFFLDPKRSFLQFFIYILVTGLLFLGGYRISKNKERFTLIFSTLLFIFLFFGSFLDMAATISFIKVNTIIDAKTFIIFLVICIIIVVAGRRISQGLVKKLLQFWVIYCVLLLCYDITVFLLSGKKEKKYLTAATKTSHFTAAKKPPVFFLLFDMYPSDTVLHKYLNYDNSRLSSFLASKDFFVTGNAHSLYEQTYYSLPSTLSLRPLEYEKDNTVKEYKKKLVALKNIEQTDLLSLFERSGYEVRNYSVFNLQGQSSPLRFNLNYHLENVLTSSTFFNRFYNGFEADFFLAARGIDLGFIKRSWSSNIKSDLSTLRTKFDEVLDNFDSSARPSFNYFHFMMPHPPVIYDSAGRENTVKGMYSYNGFDKTNAGYTGYISYSNTEIKKMLEKIFEKAGKNAVIIIQGDHGYRQFPDRFPDAVRYGILNAVYLPGKNYAGLNDTMTPIHTFKQVLKNQFDFNYDAQNE